MSLCFILGTRVVDMDPDGYFQPGKLTRSEKRRFGIQSCPVCASYNVWVAPCSIWAPGAQRNLDLPTFRAGLRCGRCGRCVSCDTMSDTIKVWNYRRPGKTYPPIPGPRKRRTKWDE